MTSFPDFSEFHGALHDGRAPFPWQTRLAELVALSGEWPKFIDVPTGVGKTTIIDIGVWAQARDAHLNAPSARVMPTRLWYVTPRRSLVDDAHARARRLACVLDEAVDGPLQAVADALRSRSSTWLDKPLMTASFMGGGEGSGNTVRDVPVDQPSVLTSTIHMYGSRLLFRGYSENYALRPVSAALVGADCAVVCDEAHLVAPLRELVRQCSQVAERPQVTGILPARRGIPQVIAMTATPTDDGAAREHLGDSDVFRLDDDDLAHRIVRQRLHASKLIRRVVGEKAQRDAALAKAVMDLIEGAGSESVGIVWTNTPDTAVKVAAKLARGKRAGIEVVTATGRMRPRDARLAAERIKQRAGVGALREQGHFVVVSTQTLEVGADLDADWMVTEPCSASAVTQRLGRLNRLGERDHAVCIWAAEADDSGSFPPYGTSPTDVSAALFGDCSDRKVEHDASPLAVKAALAGIDDESASRRSPAVTHSMIHAWAKTSGPVTGDQDVEPYIVGVSDEREPPRARVLWRTVTEPDPVDGREILWPFPIEDEIVDLPVNELLAACKKNQELGLRVRQVAPDGELVPLADLAGNERGIRSIPPGTYVLPVDLGCYDASRGGWSATSGGPVTDLSLSRGLLLPADLARTLAEHEMDREDAVSDIGQSIRLLANESTDTTDVGDDELPVSLPALRGMGLSRESWSCMHSPNGAHQETSGAPEATTTAVPGLAPVLHADGCWRLMSAQRHSDPYDDEESDLSAVSNYVIPPTLDEHNEAVGAAAASICDSIGVTGIVARSIVEAARQHDIGKADPRFQMLLSAQPCPDGLYAKSPRGSDHRSAARRSGWPRGARHEELSRRAVLAAHDQGLIADDVDIDLVAHLVVAHHGKGRPMLRTVNDSTGSSRPTTRIPITGGGEVHVANSHAIPDFEQADRFARLSERYGPWHLALMETVVRAADWLASSAKLQKD